MEIEKRPLDTLTTQEEIPEGGILLFLSGDMEISTAETDYQKLTPFYQTGQPLIFEMSQIDEIDSSGIQHLIALHHNCQQANRPFIILSPSEAVNDAIHLMFLENKLNLKHSA